MQIRASYVRLLLIEFLDTYQMVYYFSLSGVSISQYISDKKSSFIFINCIIYLLFRFCSVKISKFIVYINIGKLLLSYILKLLVLCSIFLHKKTLWLYLHNIAWNILIFQISELTTSVCHMAHQCKPLMGG